MNIGIALDSDSIAVGGGGPAASVYKRPGGVDNYKRPGGVDTYNRP